MANCPNCGGKIGVTTSRIVGKSRERFIGCKEFCGCKDVARKVVVPLSLAPKRYSYGSTVGDSHR